MPRLALHYILDCFRKAKNKLLSSISVSYLATELSLREILPSVPLVTCSTTLVRASTIFASSSPGLWKSFKMTRLLLYLVRMTSSETLSGKRTRRDRQLLTYEL